MLKPSSIPLPAAHALRKLGRDLALARRKRGISTGDMAARLFVSRDTLWRLERGDPTVALGTLGKLPEAVVEFQHALRLRPGFIDAHRNLGQVLRSLGRNLEAIDHLDEAERLQLQASLRK